MEINTGTHVHTYVHSHTGNMSAIIHYKY